MFSSSAPRRFCAPSLLRLTLAVLSLAAGALFFPFAASAGTYIWTTTDASGKVIARSPTYSGGAATYYGSSHPYGFSNGTYSGSGPGTCGGQIKALFTWKPDYPGDLPPTQVITVQTSTAALGGGSPTGGLCADGLGDPQIGGMSTGTKYAVANSSSTVAVSCTPTASIGSGSSYCYVIYTATVYPVTVNLNGALADGNHLLNMLVGQQCEGILNAGPCVLSNFQWTVPGVTFDHFYVSSNQAQGYPVFIDTSEWAKANPFWHWSSSGSYSVSATAQASINGQSLGSVSAQKNITVVTPPQVVVSTPGSASFFETTNGEVTGIQAGPSGGAGIDISATVTTPNPFAQFGYYGSYYYIQLFHEVRAIKSGSFPIPFITNGFVLDNQDPYNGSQNANAPDTVKPISFPMSDAPDQGISGFNGVNIADEFKVYIMYLPPSNGLDQQPVPIHEIQWNWTANAAKSNTGVWGPTPPGGCTVVSDSPSTEFPSWYASFVNKPGNSARETSKSLSYLFDEINFDKVPAEVLVKK